MIELNDDEKEVLITNREKIRLKLNNLESSEIKDDMSISSSASISFILSHRENKSTFEYIHTNMSSQ